MNRKHNFLVGLIFCSNSDESSSNSKAIKEITMICMRYNIGCLPINLDSINFEQGLKRIRAAIILDSNCKIKNDRKKFYKLLKKLSIEYIGQSYVNFLLLRDKYKTNNILSERGMKVPKSILLTRRHLDGSPHDFFSQNHRVVVKDNFGSSSKNVEYADSFDKLKETMRSISLATDKILIEQYIGGIECTVPWVKLFGRGVVLCPIQIIYPGKIYDYRIKNITLRNKLRIPAHVSKKTNNELRKLTYTVCNIMGIQHLTRVDLKIYNNKFYVLELNGEPLLNKNDFVARSAKSLGISYSMLIIGLLYNLDIFKRAVAENKKLMNFVRRNELILNKSSIN